MKLWLVISIGGLLSYLTRLSFIVLFGKVNFPDWLQRSLRHVPPAVLSAIIFPEILAHAGKVDFTLSNDRLIAGILAALFVWMTLYVLITLVVGMLSLLLLLKVP
jgi:branched-subunit amino acid transport protein